MTGELKPCPNPWCTSRTPPLPLALKREGWRVLCGCGVGNHRVATEAEAIATWNRRAEASPPPLEGGETGWRPTHRHVKRGTDYEVLHEARLQQASQFGPVEGDSITIYRGHDGNVWARATSEFNDGRFEPLPAPPSEGGAT